MVAELAVLDIERSPEVRRIAELVRTSGEPILLRAGHTDIAILTPVAARNRRGRRVRTAEEQATALSAFGGWVGNVDGERLKEDVLAARGSDRPSVSQKVSLTVDRTW